MERDRQEFAEFYAAARDNCLRIALISVGDRQLTEDLVAKAFGAGGDPIRDRPSLGGIAG